MKTDLLSEPEMLNTSHTSRAIIHFTESEHTVLILQKYTQSNDSAGRGRMWKRWTVIAAVAVALLLVCIYAFHKAEANAKAAAEAKAAAAQAAAAALAKAAAAAQDKAAAADKAALASQQRVMQVVGATVTSAIGYGLYWISTQGD